MIRFTVLLLLASAPCRAASDWRFAFPRCGEVVIPRVEGWKAMQSWTKGEKEVHLSKEKEPSMTVTLSAFGDANPYSLNWGKKQVRFAARKVREGFLRSQLGGKVSDRSVPVSDFEGEANFGSSFTFADDTSTDGPGDYRFLTIGYLKAPTFTFSFQAYHRDNYESRDQILDILRSVRCEQTRK